MPDYIITYSHQKFCPLSPTAAEILIQDIAHCLSLMTRANGHIRHFYSVGQHCINTVREAKARKESRRVQLACLLHDAGEAYLSDITRPVKQGLSEYIRAEARLQEVIFQKFGLADMTGEEWARVGSIDDSILYHEFWALQGTALYPTAPYMAMEHDFSLWDFALAEKEYLALYEELKIE